jgi:transcriptional regulator with XRE-family HTH domain
MEKSKKTHNKGKPTSYELEKKSDQLDKEVNDIFDPELAGMILRELMEEKGYTQEELATLLRMDRKSVQNYCNGGQYSVYTLIRLSRIFDCSVEYLLGLSDCMYKENHSVAEETGLSDGSIDRLKMAYDVGHYKVTMLYDYLIQNDDLVLALKNYYYLDSVDKDAPLTDINTNKPIETMQIDGESFDVPNLKMIYATNAIVALFDELEHMGENRSWKRKK